MAASIRQSTAVTGSPVTSVARAITPKETGNLIIAFGGAADAAATLSISDTGGHSWTNLTGPTASGGDVCQSWYTRAQNTSATTVTIQKTGTTQFMNIMLDEFIGVKASNPVDQTGSTTGSGTPTAPAQTPTADHDLMWAACNDTVTAVGTGFVKGCDDASTDWSEWKTLNGQNGIAQTATFTGSGTYNIHVALFFQEPEVAGSRLDDRNRPRSSHFWSGTSTLGTKRIPWPDDARDLGLLDQRADAITRVF